MLRDPSMAGATLVEAQASALKTAAGNEAGAVTGLMGVGMIGQMGGGGMNAGAYYDRADQQRQQQQAAQAAQPAAGAWTCSCGATATGTPAQ